MKSSFYSVILLIIILFIPVTSSAWECDVTLNAPKTIKMGQVVTLSANGTPTGGSYNWSRTKDLTPHGATATLIGHKPTYSEYIQVIAYYRTPKGKKCKDVKWIWACSCNVTSLNGPATAKVGQKVALTAKADPSGGTFTWTLASGTGTLTANGSSAEFTGDKAGTVEVKVSYEPPDGGEPCTKYHTIEIEDECEVTLTADMYQRPICRDVNLTTEVSPAGGTCSWAGAGINGNGCSAIFNKQTGGNDTVTVTYTTPGGTTCHDSASILTHSLDGMVSKKNCFESGTALQQSDFDFYTTPAGFSVRPVLSPTTVTTNESQSRVLVTASQVCDSGSSNDVSTVIDVVNKNIKTTAGIKISIPDLLTIPLEKLGLADKLKFELRNSYSKITECCVDGPTNSTGGKTTIRATASFSDQTIIGVRLPHRIQKYVKLSAFEVSISGNGDVDINGNNYGCQSAETWGGSGTLFVRFQGDAAVKAKDPWNVIVLEGKIGARTDISQTLSVESNKLNVSGKWGGIVAAGTIRVKAFGINVPQVFVTQTLVEARTTPPFFIDLPSLQ
ncbi:MAG TPA: hypothetical protein ENK89_04985 [Desulfobulbaceae bacterium]|nr:hypothetical protein [Desulfobulbaceae bacterium]